MSLEFVKVLLVFLFGLSSAENSNVIQPFIVNGTDTRIEDFPSMVSIRLKSDHLCGGTILNDEWILTAAHCLYGMPSDFSVQYATTVISQIGMNVAFAEKLVRHENYRPSIHKNDIGLLKLRTPLNITTFRKNYRATLAMIRSHYSTGSRAVLVGWGANSSISSTMKTLQRVDLQVYSRDDCARKHYNEIHFTNVCGGGVEGGMQGQCSGDSGGPLFVNGIQIGIVSWSVKPYTVPPYPGVYTAVGHFIEWIERETKINFKLTMSLQSVD